MSRIIFYYARGLLHGLNKREREKKTKANIQIDKKRADKSVFHFIFFSKMASCVKINIRIIFRCMKYSVE